jgi:heat shock protein HslJ
MELENKQNEDLQTKIIIESNTDNSMNSLDWEGTYTGIVPCADCEGIQTTINITKDLKYNIKKVYLDQSNHIYENSGTFNWNKAGSMIILSNINAENGATKYMVGENQIIQLDLNGNRITGALADKYILKKRSVTVKEVSLTETKWVLIELLGKTYEQKGGKSIYFVLQKEANKINGYAGCNNIFGTFELHDGDRISFSKIASTLMVCPDIETERIFLDILGKTDNYNLAGNKLILNRAKMAPLARFEADE